VLFGDVPAIGVLDLAKIAREGDLLLVGDVLIVEHQYGMAIHARFDRRDILAREQLGEIAAGHLTGEDERERTNQYSHVRGLLEAELRQKTYQRGAEMSPWAVQGASFVTHVPSGRVSR
jgi:hypothetical protein